MALSILILLHEFGHFFFAKLFKTRVEKFYLFFDFLFPLSGVLNFSLLKFRKGETEYGVGWFPLGGYVKIAGMVDESMDKDAMAAPPQPWEYRSKPAWQRLLIMLGGIIVNVLTAMVVYMIVFAVWGEDYLPVEKAKYGIMTDSLGRSLGLQNGDQIVKVGDKKIVRFEQIMKTLILSEAKTIEVRRNGQLSTLKIPAGTIGKVIEGDKELILARVPTVVGDVVKGSEAARMKLKEGDSIIALNGQPVFFFDEFKAKVTSMPNQRVRLSVMRGNQLAMLDGVVDSNGALGFYHYGPARFMDYQHINYSFFEAIPKGFTYTGESFADYWRQFKMIFTSPEVKISKSVGGLGTFAGIFPTEFSWARFMNLIAFVSIVLAFMNLLPIPGLDGGYVIFLLYELITRRKVSDKVMEIATTVGLVLLLALMLYANGLDVVRGWMGK